jgi:DNA-binding transcriptional regulator YhcF (GntR family)
MSKTTTKTSRDTDPAAPLADTVFSTLKRRILRCELTPGQALTELGIAEELEVSRTPIREALRRLEHEQLVQIIPRKGANVTGLAEHDIREVYLIRQALEGICGRRSPNQPRPRQRSTDGFPNPSSTPSRTSRATFAGRRAGTQRPAGKTTVGRGKSPDSFCAGHHSRCPRCDHAAPDSA